MLLAIDVGNTNITIGLFDGDVLVDSFRCESSRTKTADEYAVLLHQLLGLRRSRGRSVTASILASVVPVLTQVVGEAVRRGFGRDPLVVGPGIKTGMPILYENPREVGADRIVNAVAAFEEARGGAIVVDFGTAITFDCISPRGEYLGGCITPGIRVSAEALTRAASRLPRVDLVAPGRVVGRSSAASMQSGIVYGYAALVDGLVGRLEGELGFPCLVLATGGHAGLVAPHTSRIVRVDDALTLRGLRLVHARNAG